jgi:hypothetical protein
VDAEPHDPAAGVDPHRVAEVIVALPGGAGRRGSGYRVDTATVLTAAHVVADALRITVRFDADSPGEWGAEVPDVLADPASDLAVLVVDAPAGAPVVHGCAFGRVGIGPDELAVQAVGFPRFKLKGYSDRPSDGAYRDSHQAAGTVAPLGNRRSGTFEVTVRPPEYDAHPHTSPWEGMSGAALWAHGRIIGVITDHHRPDGLGRLAAARITRLTDGSAEPLRTALGLPPVADELPDVTAAPGWQLAASYRHQLLDLAPDPLLGRDAQLAELAQFAAGDEPYGWWQGDPWSGKTALTAWFALHPPPDVEVVPFLVAAGLAGQSDGDAFLEAVSEQLTALARRPPGAPATTAARRGGLLALLESAAGRCRESGRTLVLLVDGLDEDTGPATRKPSIASLLPRRPPAGTVVLVTSRPDRQLPLDVPADHPLRRCARRWLAPSPHARDHEMFARQELAERLRAGPLHEDLLGLITASGGGLGREDLAALTGASPFAVEELLSGAFGRSIATRTRRLAGSAGGVAAGRGYVLAHRTLRETAEREFGARLEQYRDRLHAWAGCHRDRGWPPDSPGYLLRDYPRLLAMTDDPLRLATLAADAARHERMLEATGGDALALDEIALARLVGGRQRRPDLGAAVRLALQCEELTSRNRQTPVRLPAVWAAMGRVVRAEALARGIPQRRRRTAALAAAALAAARGGHLDHVETLAAGVADPDRRDALFAAAAAGAAVHDPDRAERWARRCTPERRTTALARIATAVAGRDPGRASAIITEVAATAQGPSARTAVAVAAVAVGAIDIAEGLVADIAPARQRARARAELAVALAAAGELAKAEEIASDVRPPAAALPVLAALVRAATVHGGPAAGRRYLADLQPAARAASHRGDAIGQLLTLAVAVWRRGDAATAAELLIEAEHLVADVAEPERRDWAVARIAVARAAVGDLERSETMLDRLRDPDRRGGALTEIAVDAAADGEPERAESAARRVPGNGRRLHALTDVAAALAARGDLDRAAAVAAEAERMARSAGDPHRLAVLAVRVVDGLTGIGDLPAARAVAERIADPSARGSALTRVAEAFASSGDVAGALTVARSLDDPERTAWVLVGVCEAWAVQGRRAETVSTAADAAPAVERHFGDGYSRAVALLRLAAAVRRVGAEQEADRLVTAARDGAEGVPDPGQRARAFTQLSIAIDEAGDAARAGGLARAAASVLAGIDDRHKRDRALTRVVEVLAAAGRTGRADDLARGVTSPQGCVRALAAIASATTGDPDRAWALLGRAEALLDDIITDDRVDPTDLAAATARIADAATSVLIATEGRADDPADPRCTWLARLVATLLGGDGWVEAVPVLARLDRDAFAALVDWIAARTADDATTTRKDLERLKVPARDEHPLRR